MIDFGELFLIVGLSVIMTILFFVIVLPLSIYLSCAAGTLGHLRARSFFFVRMGDQLEKEVENDGTN